MTGSSHAWGTAHPDHCPEPARPARSPCLVGVPGAGCGRLRSQRDLPEGSGGPVSADHRRRAHLQVRAAAAGRGAGRLRRRVRVLLAAHGRALARRTTARALPDHAGVQPAGHLLAAGPALARPRRAVRLRPARPEPRALPLPVRQAAHAQAAPAVQVAAVARADDLPHRGPGDLHQRVVQEDRRRAGRPHDRERHGGAQRSGHPGDAPGLPGVRGGDEDRVLSCVPGDHGTPGRRRHDPGRDARAGPRARAHRRPGDPAGVRRLPGGPAGELHRARAGRRWSPSPDGRTRR